MKMMSKVPVGQIYRVRKWDHHESGRTLEYGLPRQPKQSKTVAVMVYLGEEKYDGSARLDLEEVMRKLGWMRIPEPKKAGG